MRVVENGSVDFKFPPSIPPEVGSVGAPAKKDAEPVDSCDNGFFADLFVWWRTRRERSLISRIRRLEMEIAAERMENERLALALVNLERWTVASIAAAERAANLVSKGGRP